MNLFVQLPASLPDFDSSVIDAVHVDAGQDVEPGSKILDFSIDLLGGPAMGCPPAAHYRLVSAETGRIHEVAVTAGQNIGRSDILALMSTEGAADEGEPARPARVTVASIVRQHGWWDDL